MPSTAAEWIAWAGIVVPFIGVAGSAIGFIWLEVQKRNDAKFQRFFGLMEQIGRKDYSIAAKMAAVFELRKYIAYADVSIRLCEDVEVEGTAAEPLRAEMKRTAAFLRSKAGK